jgi:Heterokaryon incompatibility protein (HET)
VRLSQSTNSQESFSIARLWLQQCETFHKSCRKPDVSTFMPTRLIFLGPESDVVSPKLCLSANIKEDITYATLSHCWGEKKFFTLKKDLLQDMMLGINVENLTPSFQQAMETAKRLSVNYIWIDSLCIIQDDLDDWKVESALMGDIYQNGHINIAAAKAISGADGLYTTGRKVASIEIANISANWVNCPGGTFQLHMWGEWERNVNESILLSRAWVTQEVILARRNLYFCQSQLFWECSENSANESSPGGLPNQSRAKLSVTNVEFDKKKPPMSRADAIYRHWGAIMERYTAASLRYPEKDKLLAASALARKLIRDDTLVAGLWKSNLTIELLWKQTNGSLAEKNPAPTWSWASTNGSIQFQSPLRNWSEIQRHCHFRMTGKVLELKLIDLIRITDVKDNGPHKISTFGFVKLWGPVVKVEAEILKSGTARIGDNHVSYCGKLLDKGPKVLMFLLPILAVQAYNMRIYGIYLEPTGGTKGEYFRRGQFSSNDRPVIPGGKYFSQLVETGMTTDNEDYEDIDTRKKFERHLITIV